MKKIIKKVVKKLIPKKLENKIYEKFRTKLRNTECKYKVYIDDKKKLDGKIAIITGGTGAIGSAIAFKMSMMGATSIICGRNEETAKSIIEQIRNNNGKAEFYKLDVTDENMVSEVFETIEKKYGKIDILVNNAGGSARSKANKIYEQDIDVIKDIINVNLIGAIMCARKASQIMIKHNYGRIVNIGSTVGVGGLSGYSEYSASKAGLIGFTKSFAMEVAEYGITVNCVSPGRINQILFDNALKEEKVETSYIKRKGKTDEIANAVVFFAEEEAEYIIGQNLVVDGGRSLGLKNR